MLSILLSSIILTSSSSAYTEVLGSANTSSGIPKEISITQPENYIQVLTSPPTTSEQIQNQELLPMSNNNPPSQQHISPIANQTSTIYPKDLNPLDYENKIENTIYQLGDRLIIIQSIPLKYIKKALTPNLQPTITDYPSL